MKNKLLSAILVLGLLFPGFSNAQAIDSSNTINTSGIVTYGFNDLLIYPNPTNDITHIILPVASAGVVSVFVFDLNGNIVHAAKYPLGIYKLDVDISMLPMGLYSVRVSGNGVGIHSLKLEKG